MAKRPSFDILLDPGHFISIGFGAGLFPRAPGTMGTLIGVIAFLSFFYSSIYSNTLYLLVCVFMFCIGVYLSARTSAYLDSHDHSSIVIDEIVGFMIAAYWIPLLELFRNVDKSEINFIFLPLTFVLFRFFDIVKPWPIAWVDRECQGGLGIMLDDVLAGLLTLMGTPIILFALGRL